MAHIELLAPIIFKWEGGFVNDPVDRGGATNMGVTLSTWRQMGYDKDGDGDIDVGDIKLLTKGDAMFVLRFFAWDRWNADQINNQSIANILVDWVYCSGKWGIVIPQKLLGVAVDGIVGKKTLKAVNSHDQPYLFNMIHWARIDFVDSIIWRHPEQERFRKGWLKRINSYQYSENQQ